jgi:hypothetical protein
MAQQVRWDVGKAVSQQSQIVPHLAYAEKRPLCKGMVDFPHQRMVYAMFVFGRIIQASAERLSQARPSP